MHEKLEGEKDGEVGCLQRTRVIIRVRKGGKKF